MPGKIDPEGQSGRMAAYSATPLERYFFDDGESGSDAMAHAVFDVRLEADDFTIARSFLEVLDTEPLLSATLSQGPGHELWWERQDPRLMQLLFFNRDEFHGVMRPSKNLDLRQRLPIVALVERKGDHLRFTLSFHHAACDGVGVVGFFRTWMLTCLGRAAGRLRRDNRQVDPAFLKRGDPRWRRVALESGESRRLGDGLRTLSWLARRPVAIGRANPLAKAEIAEEICVSEGSLGEAELLAVKKRATACQATLHDLLLRDAFLVIADWSSAAIDGKALSGGSHLRISVPNNLRGRGDRNLPACNVLGFAFVDALMNSAADPDALLRKIAREMVSVRHWNGGQMFLDGLTLAQRFPALYRRILASDACFATAVFSFMGNVSRELDDLLPGFELLRFFGRPPTRRNTRVAFFISIVRGALNVSVGADPQRVSSADRDRLLGAFIERLQRYGRTEASR